MPGVFSVIIVPDGCRGPEEQYRLEPGHTLRFGRTAPAGNGLTISHPAVACAAGEITATGAFWILTNFSSDQTYIVENPEGAGEHIRVAPGRADAPVPFEFARVRLCAGESRPGCGFDVLAPRHDYLTPADALVGGNPLTGGGRGGGARGGGARPNSSPMDGSPKDGSALGGSFTDGSPGDGSPGDGVPVDGTSVDGASGAADWAFDPFPRPYPLDHTCHYFLVLAALCEASLRAGDTAPAGDATSVPVPDVAELTERLRPVWPDVSRADVSWNIDYLRLKLRLRSPDGPENIREALVQFALRFDLVQEGHLTVLEGQLV
ncbi:hypothetical protein [Streptomyces sp. B15]|uniref:hypothetical protein n=1 Tax=Streptomyces sp. B15 TaxID=1537797 RepID=UPI001B37B0B4|nr:hypothetical protein [Streptomyces sp. B15]